MKKGRNDGWGHVSGVLRGASILFPVSPASPFPLSSRVPLPELFDLLADLLGLGPGPDHLGLDAALVGPATDLEEAGVAPLGAPGVRHQLQIKAALTFGRRE